MNEVNYYCNYNTNSNKVLLTQLLARCKMRIAIHRTNGHIKRGEEGNRKINNVSNQLTKCHHIHYFLFHSNHLFYSQHLYYRCENQLLDDTFCYNHDYCSEIKAIFIFQLLLHE